MQVDSEALGKAEAQEEALAINADGAADDDDEKGGAVAVKKLTKAGMIPGLVLSIACCDLLAQRRELWSQVLG